MQNRNVSYKSQWDADAGKTNNDCGPASEAMVLNYYDPNLKLTTDQVFEKTGAGQGLISFGQLVTAVMAFGYDAKIEYGISVDRLKQLIDEDTPPIALVHYGSLNSTQDKTFKGGHFFVVVGYRDDGYFVNDPNFKGNLRQDGDHHFYTKAEFEKAWNDCYLDGGNPNRSVIVIKRKTPVEPMATITQKELDQIRLDRDTNYNLANAVFSALGINLDSNDKEGSKQNAVNAILNLKKQHDEDIIAIAGIKKTNSEIEGADAKLAERLLDAEHATDDVIIDRKKLYDQLKVSTTEDALKAIVALQKPHEEVVKELEKNVFPLAEEAGKRTRSPKVKSLTEKIKETISSFFSKFKAG